MTRFIICQRFICMMILFLGSMNGHATDHIHQHGIARADMVMEGNFLDLKLTIPAASVIGFEHSPSTPKERDQVKTAIQKLRTNPIFLFYTQKGWLKKTKEVAVSIKKKDIQVIYSSDDSNDHVRSVLPHKDHHKDHHEKDHVSHHDHHNDHNKKQHEDHHRHHSDNHDTEVKAHADFKLHIQYEVLEKQSQLALSTSLFNTLHHLDQIDVHFVRGTTQLHNILNVNKLVFHIPLDDI